MTTAEGKITALENDRVTEAELAAAKKDLQDDIDTKAAQSEVNTISGKVTTLEGTVGDSSKGLVKDVADLKTTVGGTGSGLVKDVADLKAASATHATKTAMEAADKVNADAIAAEAERADAEEKRLAGLIGGNTTAIGGLDTRLGTAEGKITTAEGKISALETESAKHATQANLKAATDRIGAIEANYVKISGTNLVDQAGDVIIFDCGGAQ
jgi:hypothetical protein